MWGFSSTFGQILDQYQKSLLDPSVQNAFSCPAFTIPQQRWQCAQQQAQHREKIRLFWKTLGLDLRLGVVAHLGLERLSERSIDSETSLWIDIGTDHAKLPVAIINSKKIAYALGIDIHPNTSKIALKHIGDSKRVFFEIANGFHYSRPIALPSPSTNERQVVSICGMGGLTMIEILKDMPTQVCCLILQPNSHLDELKIWLKTNNLKITKEVLILNDQRMYVSLVINVHTTIKKDEDHLYEDHLYEDHLYEDHLYEDHLYENYLYEIPLLAWQISVLEKNYPKITQTDLKQQCEAQIQALKQKYMVFSQT